MAAHGLPVREDPQQGPCRRRRRIGPNASARGHILPRQTGHARARHGILCRAFGHPAKGRTSARCRRQSRGGVRQAADQIVLPAAERGCCLARGCANAEPLCPASGPHFRVSLSEISTHSTVPRHDWFGTTGRSAVQVLKRDFPTTAASSRAIYIPTLTSLQRGPVAAASRGRTAAEDMKLAALSRGSGAAAVGRMHEGLV